MYSVHEIWKMGSIHWVKTYKTILKYVSVDYIDILKPTVVGRKTGKRYFVHKKNLDTFIEKFEKNELE